MSNAEILLTHASLITPILTKVVTFVAVKKDVCC